jgi:hypothetical protein
MSKVMVVFSGNWADEMDVEGYETFDSIEEWNEVVEGIPDDEPLTSYIGSNQEMEWDDKKEYLKDIKVFEITDEEYKFLKKTLGKHYGKFVCPSDNW